MKNLIKMLTSRLFIVGIMIIMQLLLLTLMILRLSEYMVYLYITFVVISILVVLNIIDKEDVNPSYKLAWVIPILAFPVVGGLLYLCLGINRMSKKGQEASKEAHSNTNSLLYQDERVFSEVENLDRDVANQCRYISKFCNFPIYDNTSSKYFPVGEDMFESLKQELEEAKSFIFLEYFIIQEGEMWGSVLKILERKVREGVEVRVLYDDVGCISKLPFAYNEKLKKLGISCRVFNPFIPLASVRHNNRDHRKLAIIDGNTCFCGGINLADEYINKVVRFGHWKDTAVMLKGDAVWSFTVMFLQMWRMAGGPKEDFEKYRPLPIREKIENDGYVQPYGDNPGDGETVGEQVYMNLINKARDYVYISTPYFVVDNEILNAITLAAKDGIDVRIILPRIPDKVYVNMVAKSYYAQLLKAGVKVYEYIPGFNHAKVFISDDKLGTIGTVNLDYRSLYLHFECGVLLYNTRCLMDMKEDFMNTLKACHEVTLDECSHDKWYIRITRSILKAFAPLM